jgi:hypothetical protein
MTNGIADAWGSDRSKQVRKKVPRVFLIETKNKE